MSNLISVDGSGSPTVPENSEIVVGSVGQMAPSAQEHAGFVFAGAHHLGILRLDEESERTVLGVPLLEVGAERNEHEIVLRLAKGGADNVCHADDLIAMRSGADGFADGIDVGEKLFLEVGADKGDR